MKKEFKPTKAQKDKKLKEAIILLNDIVKVRIAPSSIEGVGVIAIKDIKKGEKIYADIVPHAFDVPFKMFNKLDKKIAEIICNHFPQVVNGSHFLYPVTKMTAFINHSDTPNYDAKEDKVLVDIKAGEELTEDYRLITNYEKIFKWLAVK